METIIRDLGDEDVAAVLAVARSLHGPQGWFNETGLDHLAIDLGFHRVWVAVRDGRIVGFLTGFTYEGIGHLGWMGVERALHHQGIGRQLMERFESAMSAAGIRELEVYSLGDSVDYPPYVPTRAFYRAMGFKDYRREKRDTWECPEALYLRKTIAARSTETLGCRPLFEKVDCLMFNIPDLAAGLGFYRDKLGLPLVWKTEKGAGLRVGESELVLGEGPKRTPETDIKVACAGEAARRFVEAGGSIVAGPFDIKIGKCVVVADPWSNQLVLLDSTKGLLKTDSAGNVQAAEDVFT